jgi:hypothetical protein
MREQVDPSANYHTVDFLYQLLQAKEISLRLQRDSSQRHGGITIKVLYDVVAAEL